MAEHQFKGDLGDVADILGVKVAQELFDKLPGIEFKVPLNIHDGHPLSLIDPNIAARLIEEFPGDQLYIPVKMDLHGQAKVAKIKQLVQSGMTPYEIAIKVHVTERYVRKIISCKNIQRPRKVDPAQYDLIDWLNDNDN